MVDLSILGCHPVEGLSGECHLPLSTLNNNCAGRGGVVCVWGTYPLKYLAL